MAIFDNYPYTNIHELNLQWLLDTMRAIKDEWESFGYSVTAEAVAGEYPNVEVSGDLINGLNFKFTLVKGEKGDKGNTGDTGNGIASVSINSNYQLTFTFTDGTYYTTPSLKGETGSGLEVLDTFATLQALQQAHPTGSAGDMYLIGTSPNFVLYLWSTSQNKWVEGGALSSPSPSETTPLMDGPAEIGLEFAYARGDHRHPSDTTKANASDLTALETIVNQKANASDVTAIDGRVTTNTNNITLLTSSKQDLLVSGTNIKTINGQSLLGAGSIFNFNFSDEEIDTGLKFIDGRSIYQKTIELTSLPNEVAQEYAHNISDVDKIWLNPINSFIVIPNQGTTPFPYMGLATGTSQLRPASMIELRTITPTGYTIFTGTDRSTWGAIITFMYVKTTDL